MDNAGPTKMVRIAATPHLPRQCRKLHTYYYYYIGSRAERHGRAL